MKMVDNSTSEPYSNLCAIHVESTDSKGNKEEGSASGILIDTRQRYILTHSSLVYPLYKHFHHKLLRNLKLHGISKSSQIFASSVNVQVTLPNCVSNDDTVFHDDIDIQPVFLRSSLGNERQYTTCSGSVRMIFESKRLRAVLQTLMPKDIWTFVGDIETDRTGDVDDAYNITSPKNEDLCYFLLPCFVLIQLDSPVPALNKNSVLVYRSAKSCRVGDEVEICATPFGSMNPEVFLNARARGIISKVCGKDKVLLMTDARCVPGCEGGGLFYIHKQQRILTGLMIASLCWKNNEWMGLSLACSISDVLGALTDSGVFNIERSISTTDTQIFESSLLSRVMLTSCYITVGANWGSGIYLDQNRSIIVTCSHVLKGAQTCSVHTCDDGFSMPCDIVYRTPAGTQFDIAVVRRKNKANMIGPVTPSIDIAPVKEGDMVFCVGYAIFKPDLDPYPMVTRGIVSKINRCGKVPVMIQTTCAIHAGSSGGGVYNLRGQLVAMVVCNSRDTVSGAFYPHVNMCVPMATIQPKLLQYLYTNNMKVLEGLEVNNKGVSHLWSIGPHGGNGLSSRL